MTVGRFGWNEQAQTWSSGDENQNSLLQCSLSIYFKVKGCIALHSAVSPFCHMYFIDPFLCWTLVKQIPTLYHFTSTCWIGISPKLQVTTMPLTSLPKILTSWYCRTLKSIIKFSQFSQNVFLQLFFSKYVSSKSKHYIWLLYLLSLLI